jgi:hypothetical protein
MEILLVFFILMCGAIGILMGKKLTKARARRIEEYRGPRNLTFSTCTTK